MHQSFESIHLSEDDIRTKVVYEWLKDCGISISEIRVEYSINIRLGRKIRTIHSRADILVTNNKGANLLIIEVKKPGHAFHENDKYQALSYARALSEGGIAPFTILTNGKHSLIFDSITGQNINSTFIPNNHNYIRNNFKISADVINTYSEALEYLISFSVENLMEFCKGQVQHRMISLKSSSINSGKKYIPQLYVDRHSTRLDLERKLFNEKENRQVVMLVGPPQHGKTSFLCYTAEELLRLNIPCLFYPAVALNNSLINTIIEDFEWSFGQNFEPHHLSQKLERILRDIEKNFIIIVDGWNEMINQALSINDDFQRLCNGKIKLLVSTTSPSVLRLLNDNSGNQTAIADNLNLSSGQIRKLTSQPLKNTENIGVIQIGKFDDKEMKLAKDKYEKKFNVKFNSDSNLPNDPFYLRLASEQYSGFEIPSFSTQSNLIKESLIRKASRSGINEIDLFRGLKELAQIIFNNDAPLDVTYLSNNFCSDAYISNWIECAILILTREKTLPQFDFYYTHDRDYSIAIIYRKWDVFFTILKSPDQIKNELLLAIETEAGKSALLWFLSSPDYCDRLELIFTSLNLYIINKKTIYEIISQSILNQVNFNKNVSFSWLTEHVDVILNAHIKSNGKESEFSELIFAVLESFNKNIKDDHYIYWLRQLVKYDNSVDELGVTESLVFQIYESDDIKMYPDYYDESDFDYDIFTDFLFDEEEIIASRAAQFLSYVDCTSFIEYFLDLKKKLIELNRNHVEILRKASATILIDLNEMYYGSMCGGMLTESEPGDDWVKEEYLKMKSLLEPIILTFVGEELSYSLLEILNNLYDIGFTSTENEIDFSLTVDPNQLKLDL
ncbi:type I restriction enzyme HsdR N-terminal domain-containing protein [Flavobacterium sp. FlaQc-30]|uniref:type I restriction enzyme HsdR N-terminal domain-containing protein n=1 Tax=Flavobacterium sp. FlaQc-30 TaxID=3374179 RepID=UPI0037581331